LPGSIGAISRGWLCWSLAELGAFGEGIAQGRHALAIAETADHPFSLVDACRELGCLYIRLGDSASAAALLERGLGLAQSRDLALWLPSFGSALGYAYALLGRHHEGTALLETAVEQASALGIVAGQALRLAWLAEAHLLNGDSEKADAVARQAVELSTRHDERGNRACALRMVGEIALRRPEPDLEAAGQALSAALLAAESLGMRPLAAQCRLGSAELSARLGRREHAETERANAASLLDEMRRSAGLQAPAIG